MTDEKSKELAQSSFAAQMAMLGYEPNGNPKDMVEVVRCKDCKHGCGRECGMYFQFVECEKTGAFHKEDWFCADGEKEGEEQ